MRRASPLFASLMRLPMNVLLACHARRAAIARALTIFAIAFLLPVPASRGANITWIGGNGTWSDGVGNDANWNPADEPDTNDVAIFNTNNTIEMGTSNSIAGLTMSTNARLNVN